MSTEISFADLDSQFFEVMKRVCRGESFVILVDRKQVAELRPHAAGCADEEAAKVLEELSSPRFEGAQDKVVREWLGE